MSSDSATNTIREKMGRAGTVIKAVTNKFLNNPAYSMFVYFKINKLELSSVSTDPDKNLIMYLENSKNGTGYANQFRLQIAYAPKIKGTGVGDGLNDINMIDINITTANSANADISQRYCELQYGYADEGDIEVFRSPLYKGMVLDYSCEIQDGFLIYNITGFSGLSTLKESKEALSLNIPKNSKDTLDQDPSNPGEGVDNGTGGDNGSGGNNGQEIGRAHV